MMTRTERDAMSRRRTIYLLSLLCLANAFNLADRMLLGITQEPIRREFALSDLQLGLLGGPAFAILYSLAGLPIARLAERTNRIAIIGVALAWFSGMTALCGVAGSYAHLLLARLGISAGEAGSSPPSVSLIAEYLPPANRATAMAVYSIGGPAGALLAILVGGAITQVYGWRASFLCFGIAGILTALVLLATLSDRRRDTPRDETMALGPALVWLAQRRSFVHICIAAAFMGLCSNFIQQYMASFLIRVHHLPLTSAAMAVGFAGGIAGIVGAFGGGYLADRIARGRPAARLIVAAAGQAIAGIGYLIAFWSPLALAIPLLFVASAGLYSYISIAYAATTTVVRPTMRATAIALFTLAYNLLGYALGPPILGSISDAVAGIAMDRAGIDRLYCSSHVADVSCLDASGFGLRWALTIGALFFFASAFHAWLASRHVMTDRIE